MAKGRIEQEIALKVTGTKDVKDAAKLVDSIDDKAVELKVGVDTGEATRDIDGLISKVDKLGAGDAANLLLATNASQIAQDIADLVLDLDKLDANDPQVNVTIGNIAGLQSDLDKLSAKAKELNDKVTIDIDADDKASADLDDVRRKASALDGTDVDIDVTATGLDGVIGKFEQLPGAIGAAAGALRTLGTAGGIGAAAGAALALADNLAEASLSAEVLAGLTGDSLENASRLQAVWKTTGADVNDLADVLLQMNGVLADSPELAKQIGINLGDGATIGERFIEVFKLIKSGAIDTATQSKLLGEEGVRQVARLTASYDDLDEALADIADSQVFTDEERADLEDFTESMNNLKVAAANVGATIGDRVVPVLEFMFDAIEDAKGAIEWLDQHAPAEAKNAGISFGDLFNGPGDVIEDFKRNFRVLIGQGQEFQVNFSDTLAPVAEDAKNADPYLRNVGNRFEVMAGQAERFLEREEEIKEATEDIAEAAAEAADEWEAMADAISEQSFQEAIDQFNSLSELDLAQMRQNTVGSFDAVKEAIKTAAEEVEGWGRMDLTPDSFDELRGMPDQFAAITDAISGMRGSIQTELKAAFDTGGIQEFSSKFDFFAGQVREQFTNLFRGLGLPEDQVQAQVNAILADLSLLPEQKEIIIQLTLAQEGRNALDLFMDEITGLEALNPEVDIKAKIAAGDIAGALAELNALRIAAGRDPIVLPTEVSRVGLERATQDAVTAANNYARNHPAVIPSKVGTPTGAAAAYTSAQKTLASYGPLIIGARVVAGAQVRYDAGGTVTGDGGIAGERGPEILDGKYLTAGPTYVPPGTRVTSRRRTQVILNRNGGDGLRRYDNGGTVVAGPRTINVNVNAAVVGNRFDVARAVSRANGDIARLMGTRG